MFIYKYIYILFDSAAGEIASTTSAVSVSSAEGTTTPTDEGLYKAIDGNSIENESPQNHHKDAPSSFDEDSLSIIEDTYSGDTFLAEDFGQLKTSRSSTPTMIDFAFESDEDAATAAAMDSSVGRYFREDLHNSLLRWSRTASNVNSDEAIRQSDHGVFFVFSQNREKAGHIPQRSFSADSTSLKSKRFPDLWMVEIFFETHTHKKIVAPIKLSTKSVRFVVAG